jgi:glycine dehydrogenase subunit 2
MKEKLIFEISKKGRCATTIPESDIPKKDINELIPNNYLRKSELNLPEVSEVDIIRHFTRLSQINVGVDTTFYPLGSCTMKYNPKVNEDIANFEEFLFVHPYFPEEFVQGSLQIMYELIEYLKEISGMDDVSLQPAAGAHGELTSLLIIKAYHNSKNRNKDIILVPDSAHGTNPASASLAGYKIIEVKSDMNGNIDINDLKAKLNDNTAAIMITNPNTLGLFEENILEISSIIHKYDALVYYDGANMNAILGITRPADMGCDIMHFNLHKTFSTPHGAGGPGAGPIAVKKHLSQFLPIPRIEKKDGKYILNYNYPNSIGRVRAFYCNFLVCLKAYAYIRTIGNENLKRVSELAVLNANYLLAKLKKYFEVPYNRICKHEFVISGKLYKKYGIRTLDIAKRLLDYGFHAPTIYFPLIVEEALMIEPTETESKETLDEFVNAIEKIVNEIKTNPSLVIASPHNMSVSRLDEVKAAKDLNIRYKI